jgi:hypothetical protein
MKKAVLSALVLFSLAAQAQKVSNKLQFQKGQKLEMLTTVKSASEMMGQSLDVNVVSTRVLDVADLANGNAVIESKIKRLQVDFNGMGQNQTFDSDREEDRNSEMGKGLGKVLKNKYTMTVDPYGKITAVKADADNPNNAADSSAGAQDMMGGMMEGLMAGFSLPKAGDATDFALLPAKEVGKGDTWTDTTSADKDVKRKAVYTVSDITANEVLLKYTEDVAMKTTKENMGMEVTIDKQDKNTGNITLDRKTGLLKQKTITTETSGTASVMGQEIPLDTKVTTTVVVTPGK